MVLVLRSRVITLSGGGSDDIKSLVIIGGVRMDVGRDSYLFWGCTLNYTMDFLTLYSSCIRVQCRGLNTYSCLLCGLIVISF